MLVIFYYNTLYRIKTFRNKNFQSHMSCHIISKSIIKIPTIIEGISTGSGNELFSFCQHSQTVYH